MNNDIASLGLPRPSPVGGAEAFELTPFEVDAGPLKLLQAVRTSPTSVWWSLLAVPIVTGILVSVTAIEGTLVPRMGFEVVLRDLRSVLFTGRNAPTAPDFPFLRDTATIGILLCLTLCLPQLTKQWRLMHAFWRNPISSGVLILGDSQRAASLFRGCNRRFSQVSRYSVGLIFVALLLSLVLALGQRTSGVFRTFGPFVDPANGTILTTGEGARQAYDGWWAGVENPIGFATYVFVATFSLYYILLQNYVGFEFCVLALRLRKGLEVCPDPRDPRNAHGWREFGLLMRTVANSMAFTALALSIFLLILPGTSYLWLGTLVLLWIVGASLYIGTPTVLLLPAMRRWRRRVYDDVARDGAAAPGSSPCSVSFAEAQAIEEMYRFIGRVTVLPARYRVQAVAAYLLPLGLGIYSIM